jgi:hypothetical protein
MRRKFEEQIAEFSFAPLGDFCRSAAEPPQRPDGTAPFFDKVGC